MINEIKKIVQNYLNNAALCRVLNGVVEADGIRVNNKLIVPNDLILGNLKSYVSTGDKVQLIRNHGGQEFYIVEIIDKEFILKGAKITLTKDGIDTEYTIKDVVKE